MLYVRSYPYKNGRASLVALVQRGVRVSHILDDGSVVSHAKIEERLLELSGRSTDDFFAPPSERLAAAYRERARKGRTLW